MQNISNVLGGSISTEATAKLTTVDRFEMGNIRFMNEIPTPIKQEMYLVNGELRKASPSDSSTEIRTPIPLRDEKGEIYHPTIGSYPNLTGTEATFALDAACKAFDGGLGRWPTMSITERVAAVEEFLTTMVAQREQVVRLIMWEISKTRADAEKEFDRTVKYIQDTIKEALEIEADTKKKKNLQGLTTSISRQPRGVTLCMGPFNYPLNETLTTVVPALIMGNTVIFKPAKYGVMLFEPLLKGLAESFPPGTVNVIYGDGQEVISPLMKSGKIDSLAFIGTARVAKILMSQHPEVHRLHLVLGLGAKNPAIIMNDADPDKAAKEIISGALSFNGQRCTALKLIFVPRKSVDKYLAAINREIQGLKIGLPWEDGVQLTPLAEDGKVASMQEMIKDAHSKGSKTINPGGGESIDSLMTPALLYPVDPSMRIFNEEQFGPIVPVVPYDDIQEVIDYIKGSQYGQQAALFSESPEKYSELISALERLVARVNINSQCQRSPDTLPFLSKKDSGRGALSIRDALDEFSIPVVTAYKAA